MKTESTASAVRSATTPPAPGFSTLTTERGTKSLGEMIESIDEGLIVYQPLGGGQSNLLMGEFSLNIGLGFKIERGKIAGRVKNTMVAGNVYDTFRRVEAVSGERQLYEGCLSPAFLFDAVPVASAE